LALNHVCAKYLLPTLETKTILTSRDTQPGPEKQNLYRAPGSTGMHSMCIN